jgi:hypothetical protein
VIDQARPRDLSIIADANRRAVSMDRAVGM